MRTISPDEHLEDADWTRQSWDLPPYKSGEFLALVRDLDSFRSLPVYQHAVANGLIHDDEWVADLVVLPRHTEKIAKRKAQGGATIKAVSANRPPCRIGQKKLHRVLVQLFRKAQASITEQAVHAFKKRGITKDAETSIVDEVMGGIDFTVFNQAPASVQPILESLYSDAGHEALRSVMVAVGANKGAPELNPVAWDQVDSGAIEYAQARAAEMVGMRRTTSGKLIENPNAKWAITSETRLGVRALVEQTAKGEISVLELPDRLRDAYAFSAGRAEMIARTEMRMANGQGALGGLIAAGNVQEKVWITQEDDGVSDECQENADEGPISIYDDFPSGDQTEPAHPNCRCSVAGHVDWGSDEE